MCAAKWSLARDGLYHGGVGACRHASGADRSVGCQVELLSSRVPVLGRSNGDYKGYVGGERSRDSRWRREKEARGCMVGS